MNTEKRKKANTAIFVAIATVINVLMMLALMLAGYILLLKFGNPESTTANQIWLVVIFLGSIVISWFIYSRLVKRYMKKVNVEEKFAPLIGSSKRKGPKGPDDMSSMKG